MPYSKESVVMNAEKLGIYRKPSYRECFTFEAKIGCYQNTVGIKISVVEIRYQRMSLLRSGTVKEQISELSYFPTV